MRAVVALGNPGPRYAITRHNAGFLLADSLADHWEFPPFRARDRALVTEGTVGSRDVLLLKPQTYMNRSGAALRPLLVPGGLQPAHDLLVLVDDIALPMGTFRVRARGSAGGHNGLVSVEEAVGSTEYARLRIGVGPRPEGINDQAEWLLEPFTRDEQVALVDLLPALADAVECWIVEGVDEAMNRFNRRGTEE